MVSSRPCPGAGVTVACDPAGPSAQDRSSLRRNGPGFKVARQDQGRLPPDQAHVNSVTMTDETDPDSAPKRGYHHGDLRSALVFEGLRLLAAQDADTLSLREVARAVGVSATSVYRHFPDKTALLTALAAQGLAQLGAEQTAAAEAAGGGEAGFLATGRAYVRFARANPALFRLIFATPILNAAQDVDPAESDANRILQANAVDAAARDGTEARIHALRSWGLVHGIAMLALDGQIEIDDAMIDRVIA